MDDRPGRRLRGRASPTTNGPRPQRGPPGRPKLSEAQFARQAAAAAFGRSRGGLATEPRLAVEQGRSPCPRDHRRAIFSGMDPLTFDYEDLHLRVDRGVFELFNLGSPESTLRVPPGDEPLFRAYFAQVAALADRRVV